MRPISTAETARMRAASNGSMRDTCKLGVLTETADGAYTNASVSWGATIACGLQAVTSATGSGGSEANDSQTPTNQAVLRLPVGTVVDQTSRVRVYSKAGFALPTPQEYAVIGAPQYGSAHIVLNLRAITAGGGG